MEGNGSFGGSKISFLGRGGDSRRWMSTILEESIFLI